MKIWPSREFALGVIGNGHNEAADFSSCYERRVAVIVAKQVTEGVLRPTLMTDCPIYQVSDGHDSREFVVMSLGDDAYSDGQVLLKVTHESGRGRKPVMRFEVGSYPTRQSSSGFASSGRITLSKAERLLRAIEVEIRVIIPE